MFNQIKTIFTPDKYKLIIIPSYRTPKEIINKSYDPFGHNHKVFKDVDKKAYLSSMAISDIIVVTCDSTSMISEASITGKPIYVANMTPIRNNYRFQNFFSRFKQLNIIKDLTGKIELWSYNELNEVKRISNIINEKIKNMELIKSLENRTKMFNTLLNILKLINHYLMKLFKKLIERRLQTQKNQILIMMAQEL